MTKGWNSNKDAEAYERLKAQSRERIRRLSRTGRELGPLPAVVDPTRKANAERDFRYFCEVYFPQIFYLPWSQDHLRVIAKIEQAILHGGLFAVAMPRGSGKTSLCECACIWAMLYGHRDFVCLIGADESHAKNMLDSIKTELETNDRLLEDFPEVIYPIRQVEGNPHRCRGQLYQGERTYIEWSSNQIVLPRIPGSKASNAVIRVSGILGRIRGLKYQRPDGSSVRPSLVIIDDPQTDDSARSRSECMMRERILAGAILGLAGPGKKISGIMPCTVIRPGDVADNILNRDKHPE